jgi:hypothetical protein
MPIHSRVSEPKVFCKDEVEWFVKPTIIIKGGGKTRNGHCKYSEALIRAEFEKQLAIYLTQKIRHN